MLNVLKTLGILPDPHRFTFSWIPLAIMAGAGLAKSVIGGKKKRDEASASKEAFDQTEANRLEAARVGHADTERSRMGRASGIASQLAGTDFAIDPSMLEAGQTERGFTGYTRESPEVTGSFMGDLAGGVADVAGQAASAYMKGLGPGGEGGGGGAEFGADIAPRGVTTPSPIGSNALTIPDFKKKPGQVF
jgi:hypothetical protein